MQKRLFLGLFILLMCGLVPVAVHATDFWVDGIEVTQSIQCFDQSKGYTTCPDNSLELTTGKPIAIRVYINHDGMKCPDGIPNKVVEANLPVTVSWVAGHKGESGTHLPTTVVKNFNVPCSTNLDNLRNDDNNGGERSSVVVTIPGDTVSLRKDAWLWVQAEIATMKDGKTIDPKPDNNVKEILLGNDDPDNFKAGVFLRNAKEVLWVRVDDGRGLPNEYMAMGGSTLMQRTYPFPVYYYPAGTILDWKCPECKCRNKGCPELLDKLAEFKSYYKPGPGSRPPDAVIGWVKSDLISDYGGARYSAAWASLRSDSFILTNLYGVHEVGHIFGSDLHQDEKGCSQFIEETGFYLMPATTFINTAVRPSNEPDYMYHAVDLDSWISPDVYNTMLGQTSPKCPPYTESSSGARSSFSITDTSFATSKINSVNPTFGVLGTGPIPSVVVSGMAQYNGQQYSGSLKPVFALTSDGPFLENDPAGEYCVQFLDLSGPINGERYCFSNLGLITFDPPSPSGETMADSGMFIFKLPLPLGATGIQLLHGSEVLAARVMSTQSPVVTLNPPAGGTVNGKFTISWTGSDGNGDALVYHVLYSHDQGSSWVPLATYIDTTSIEVDSQFLAGGANALIRVMASDGFNTANADSAPLQITNKPPIVFIESPQEGLVIPATRTVGLSAGAQDLEDGMMGGKQIIWTSNKDGQLGMGSELWLDPGYLSLGDHIITVTATDSAHQTASASVRISVANTPAIQLKKVATPTAIYRGNSVTYTYKVINTGDVPLKNIQVTDDKVTPMYQSGDTNVNGLLDLPETWMYTATNSPTNTVTNTATASGTDSLGLTVRSTDAVTVVVTVQVKVDVKPGSCPNGLGLKDKGVVPFAILGGSPGYTLNEIDLSSIKLNGIPTGKSNSKDVATPYFGTGVCGCHILTQDGILDALFQISTPEIVQKLGNPAKKSSVPLTLTGTLKDGITLLQGTDCVKIS